MPRLRETYIPNGDVIRRQREALGWTQCDLAARSNVSAQHIDHWENHRKRGSAVRLHRIANALGLKFEDIATPVPSGGNPKALAS